MFTKYIDSLNRFFSHSNTVDALRVAIQASVAVAVSFIIFKLFGITEVFVGLLSAALVVEPSVGGTLHASVSRVIATFVGSAIGFICLLILPWGYGTIIAVCISVMLMSFIATLRSNWHYGIVGTIAIALASPNDPLMTALERLVSIGIGSFTGIIASFFIWPDKSSSRAKRQINDALKSIASWLDENAKQTIKSDDDNEDLHYQDSGKSYSFIEQARQSASAVKWANDSYLNEFIDNTNHLFNSVVILNRVAQKDKSQREQFKNNANSREGVEQAVSIVKKIIDAIVENKNTGEVRGLMQELDDKVELIVSSANEIADHADKGNQNDAISASVIAFAFEQLDKSLTSLIDCYEKIDMNN